MRRIRFQEGQAGFTGLLLPARGLRRIDVLLFDGKVARIIGAADATRRIGHNAVPLLAILAPGADRAIFLLRSHVPKPPKQAFPIAVCVGTYLDPDLESRKFDHEIH